ncbi:MAG: hypothetical protein QOI53_685 [Verrucomicrobiota bacterium]|nr:hypothetical protein [Verrucomicrobiota bacterium]
MGTCMNQQPENVSGELGPNPGSEASPALPFPGQERSEDLVGTLRIIRKFNRSTTWVASGLLGSVIFAALMVAFQERNSEPAGNDGSQAKQVGDAVFSTEHPANLPSVANIPENTANVTPAPIKSDDQGLASIGKDDPAERGNVIGWSPVPRHDLGRRHGGTNSKTTSRTSTRPRYVGVKARLLALWHQSLAHNEKGRSWTRFSKVKEGDKERVSYTARTNH